MSDDSKELSRVEDILSGEDYLPKKPMSRVEELLMNGAMVPKVDDTDNGKILKVIDGKWQPGDDVSGDNLPPVSSLDNGKVLKVVSGEWNIGDDKSESSFVYISSTYPFSGSKVALPANINNVLIANYTSSPKVPTFLVSSNNIIFEPKEVSISTGTTPSVHIRWGRMYSELNSTTQEKDIYNDSLSYDTQNQTTEATYYKTKAIPTIPPVDSTDVGKVLKATAVGEYDWDNASGTDEHAVHIPPVIFDDNGLKKIDDFSDFPGIKKVYLTQSAYNALTTAEKEDLSKIYYISDYEFYPSDDGKVVIRFNDDGTEKLIFFDGFVDDWSSTPYSNFPEELRTIVTSNATWGSAATILSTNYDSEGVVRSGNQQYFGFRTLQDWHVNSCDSSGGSYAAKNKANYAILDMLDNSTYQQSESWSDPYDIPYGYDTIYYGGKEYEDFVIPKELPYVTSADEGKALVVNSQGIWVKGNIREVPAIHLGDNDKILTVESGEAIWASAKKVTHLYDEIPISDPLYLLGTISPSTSPLTIDMTQITANYEELRSTDFAFVFIAEASNAISIPKQYNPVDNDFGIFEYTPSTGQLTVTMSSGYTTGTLVGVVYKKAIIQLNENAKITGQSGTIDCTDVPNADTLTVSDFGIVITHVTYPRTSNTGVDTVAPTMSYNQTTKQLSWSVNAVSWDLLDVTGYVIVGNYGDPEYRLITNFVGATDSSDGYRGYVPGPVSSDKDKFLKGDGTWNPVYRELTQAEYDALPSSKNSDGIIYFITDNS